jgi:hypothetical protein
MANRYLFQQYLLNTARAICTFCYFLITFNVAKKTFNPSLQAPPCKLTLGDDGTKAGTLNSVEHVDNIKMGQGAKHKLIYDNG